MGAFFLGVLRSGTIDAMRVALAGLDVEIAPIPTLGDYNDPTVFQERPPAVVWDGSGAPGYLRLIIEQEWPQGTWERAAAIAGGESSFNPAAHNTAGEDSRGLWQINVVPQANIDLLALGDLFDPRTNAKAARIVWERQGWRAWQNVAIALGIPLSGPGVA